MQTDDNFVKTVSFFNHNPQTGVTNELKNEADEIYNHLVVHDYCKFYIRINDNIHEIPTVGGSAHDHKCDIEPDHWYTLCRNQSLSTTHASTLSTFFHQFEKTMQDLETDSKKTKQKMSDDELAGVLNKSLEFFDDVVVREQIYRLNVRRAHVKEEIAKLELIKSRLE